MLFAGILGTQAACDRIHRYSAPDGTQATLQRLVPDSSTPAYVLEPLTGVEYRVEAVYQMQRLHFRVEVRNTGVAPLAFAPDGWTVQSRGMILAAHVELPGERSPPTLSPGDVTAFHVQCGVGELVSPDESIELRHRGPIRDGVTHDVVIRLVPSS